jgi:hypothetical protein
MKEKKFLYPIQRATKKPRKTIGMYMSDIFTEKRMRIIKAISAVSAGFIFFGVAMYVVFVVFNVFDVTGKEKALLEKKFQKVQEKIYLYEKANHSSIPIFASFTSANRVYHPSNWHDSCYLTYMGDDSREIKVLIQSSDRKFITPETLIYTQCFDTVGSRTAFISITNKKIYGGKFFESSDYFHEFDNSECKQVLDELLWYLENGKPTKAPL